MGILSLGVNIPDVRVPVVIQVPNERLRIVVELTLLAVAVFRAEDECHELGGNYRCELCFCCAGTNSSITALRMRSAGNRPCARIKSWNFFWLNLGPSAFSVSSRSSISFVYP